MSGGGEPSWFETLGERTVHEGFSTVVVETVRTPGGETVEREIVRHAGAVAVVPVTTDGRILLLKQYRQPLRRHVLEIPAGTRDVPGEDVVAVAHRELIEETGHDSDQLTPIGRFHNSVGWSTEETHLFLARDVRPAPAPEGFEPKAEEAAMEVVPFTVDDALELARTGQLTDAKTVLGLLYAAPHLGHGGR